MCVVIEDLKVVVGRFGLQPSVALADAEGSKSAVWSEDEASLLGSISWALCDLCEDIVFVIVVEVLSPEVCIFLDGDSHFLRSVTISVEEICNEIVLMLDRVVGFHEFVVLSVSSNSALGAFLCVWDFEFFLSPCVEGFQFDSCIVSSEPLFVDFLLVLVGLIVCLTCGGVISPHCLHICIGLLFDFG